MLSSGSIGINSTSLVIDINRIKKKKYCYSLYQQCRHYNHIKCMGFPEIQGKMLLKFYVNAEKSEPKWFSTSDGNNREKILEILDYLMLSIVLGYFGNYLLVSKSDEIIQCKMLRYSQVRLGLVETGILCVCMFILSICIYTRVWNVK